ncbi:MAG: hypothetical protein LBR77_07615 [Lachnospiraceae bacterium]|jgi:hypothetical protein|nr:hypothetical protein [Lachnospiraceae bacterium]
MLGYLIAHNRDHAGELEGIAKKLDEAGFGAAAAKIRDGVAQISAGNEIVGAAAEMIP